MSNEETIKLGYSASSNVSFHGTIDTGIPREEWAEMTEEERDSVLDEFIYELVDIHVENE